jgi:hypothetical protein
MLVQQHTSVIMATGSQDMSQVRRDSNLVKTALPLVGSMLSLMRADPAGGSAV